MKKDLRDILSTATGKRPKTAAGMAAFLADLDKFAVAAVKLSRTWEKLDTDDTFTAGEGYPRYLPSFDEFASDAVSWRDSVERADVASRRKSKAAR